MDSKSGDKRRDDDEDEDEDMHAGETGLWGVAFTMGGRQTRLGNKRTCGTSRVESKAVSREWLGATRQSVRRQLRITSSVCGSACPVFGNGVPERRRGRHYCTCRRDGWWLLVVVAAVGGACIQPASQPARRRATSYRGTRDDVILQCD